MEGICQVLWRPGGNTGGVPNNGVAVSETTEADLQVMIYYIKHFNSIGRTFIHSDIDLDKVNAMYHHQYMEEAQKDPELVPTFDPKYWPNTLETVEEYIRGFLVKYVQPLSYLLRDDLIAPVSSSDPMYFSNGSKYFTHYDEMVAHGSIPGGSEALGSDPEVVGTFTDLFITYRALIWDNIVCNLSGI